MRLTGVILGTAALFLCIAFVSRAAGVGTGSLTLVLFVISLVDGIFLFILSAFTYLARSLLRVTPDWLVGFATGSVLTMIVYSVLVFWAFTLITGL
jgi:hypothetical protein